MGIVKVGFIGAGGIASIHLKHIDKNEEAEIVAICDISPETAQEQSSRYHANAYTDVDEMLEKESLDAVFISVPPFAHSDIEEKVVQRGIHIFVEKPVELDIKAAKKKAEVIHNAGVINAAGYCIRYWDTVQKAKQYLSDKKIAMVRGYYMSGFVKTPWYRIESKSGDQLVEQSTHILDLLRYLGGEIKEVSADMALQVSDHIEGVDIPDVTSVNVRFESGAVGHLDSTFTQTDHRIGVELLGHHFRVEIKGNQLTIIEKDQTITHKAEVNFYEVQDAAFIQAVQQQNQSLVLASYEEGVKTLAVSLAAKDSNENGEKVRMQEYVGVGS